MSATFNVVFALYPRVTQLDFTGPYEVLTRLPGARCVLASVAGGDLEVDSVMRFAGLQRLDRVDECDLLCVPGGFGTVAAVEDQAYLSAIRRLGEKARYITSVCTGSLLLAAAGLLRGRRAACHWMSRELLRELGAIPVADRVVRDGNIISGGGVTAGIDFGLTMLAEIAGQDVAEMVQLRIEYNPQPPFRAGAPELAREEIRDRLMAVSAPLQKTRLEQARRLGARLAQPGKPAT